MLSQLSRQSFWLLLTRLGSQAGMAVFTILLARHLGLKQFGEYAFMAGLVAIGNMVSTFGTDMILIREIAREGQMKSLPRALRLQVVLSITFIAFIVLFAPTLSFQSGVGQLALQVYSLALFPLAVFTVCTTALRGKQRMGVYGFLNVSIVCIQVFAVWITVVAGGSLIHLACVLFGVQCLAAGLAWWLCLAFLPDFKMVWQTRPQDVFELAKKALPVAIFSILGVIYQRLPVTLLPFLAGTVETGEFSSVAKLVEVAKVGHIAIFTAIYPMMASTKTIPGWLKQFRQAFWVVLTMSVLLSIGLSWVAEWLVGMVFGLAYIEAVPALQILVWTLIPYAIGYFLILALLADEAERSVAWSLSASLGLLAVLMILFSRDAEGTAWAVLVSEVLFCFSLAGVAVRRFRPAL